MGVAGDRSGMLHISIRRGASFSCSASMVVKLPRFYCIPGLARRLAFFCRTVRRARPCTAARNRALRAYCCAAAAALFCLTQAHAAVAAESPWNGTWTLDTSRPEPQGGADDYRLTLSADGALRWEIPSLHEDNRGRLDGRPMAINRPGGKPGMTISVSAEAPRVWHYVVALNGAYRGEGRMTLAPDGRSWTDMVLDHGRPVEKLTLIYVKE